MSQNPSSQLIAISYKAPENFDRNYSAFDVYKKFPDEFIRFPKIKILRNFRISSNSVVFNYFNIIRESCIGAKIYNNYRSGYGFFLKYIFPKLNFSKKRFLVISDEWTSNYYHWHLFALKKLAIFKENGLLENSLIFLPKKYQRFEFAISSLEKFGIKKEQIVFLRKKSHIKTRELALIKAPHRFPQAIIQIRNTLLQNVKPSNFGDKIYISRNKQKLRFLENEAEVIKILSRYGFKKIFTEDLSYQEQISICANAKYIVSPHGAGLTNLLFAKENAAILEFSGKPEIWKPVTDYYRLCNILEMRYFYQQCEFGENSHEKNFHCGSLLVDLATLEKNLKLMLKDEPESFTKPLDT